MITFYKKFFLVLLGPLLLSALVGFQFIYLSKTQTALMPEQTSSIPWRAVTSSDADNGGSSTVKLKESEHGVAYDFLLKKTVEYPYASLAIRFLEQELNVHRHIDLSHYNKLTFNIRCQPENILSFTIFSFDEKVSKAGDLATYRIPSTYFSCSPTGGKKEIQLDKLETPDWWLSQNASLASKNYSLKKTSSITFGNSAQSPLEVNSNVFIENLVLEGRSHRKLLLGAALLCVIWGIFAFWAFKEYVKILTTQVQARLQKDIPFIAYQQLSLEPHKDKERDGLLRLMVTEYQDPELSMDSASKQLGMNKTKINEILKQEVGLTFNAYLNKLRLTEAARLLCENSATNVGEAAHLVGYNNVSYFNRLFKSEYGCTPKAFKNLGLNKNSQ
jgi:AraC-like DNA-binding protein